MSPSRTPSEPSGLSLISGAEVRKVLDGKEDTVVGLVQAGYEAFGRSEAVNPHSSFLLIPGRPQSRIIALPAATADIAGIKWISSWPQNIDAGLPRASSVIILNDTGTGFPLACLEGTFISAARTAASATLAARLLTTGSSTSRSRVGFLGTGMIAREVHRYLAATGWELSEIGAFDLSPERCESFLGHVAGWSESVKTTQYHHPQDLVRNSDLLVLATVASAPHLTEASWFSHHPLVLELSLRDLAPEVILGSVNVVDDVDHCLRAGTSLHLTEQQTGDRSFVYGTLHDVMHGRTRWSGDRTCVFSPFGLGVLDLFVARFVLEELTVSGRLHTVDGFFDEVARSEFPAPHSVGQ
jgi:ornithine cyclodeaminase